jgi:hypothetical protein
MPAIAALVAAGIYLLPIVGLALFRAQKRSGIVLLSVEIPTLVAVDLLLVLGLAFVVRLGISAWVARGIWLIVGGALAFRSRGKWAVRWSRADLGVAASALFGSVLCLVLSLQISRSYSIWDRDWHVPLAASLRGQKLPFHNVYFQPTGLHYHFTGDALAAVLQSFSFGVINSDHALALAHDIMFALAGLCATFLLRAVGVRGVPASLGSVAVLLTGPVAIFRRSGTHLEGFSSLSFFTMSFRPHVSLAALLFVGFLGIVILRLRGWHGRQECRFPLDHRNVVLIATSTLLAVTDETSTGLLGLALGAAWLVEPRIVHPRRAVGLFVLTALLVSVVGINLALNASLAHGTAVHSVRFVDWRLPGYSTASLSLKSAEGVDGLLLDMFAVLAAILGFSLFVSETPTRKSASILAFLVALGVVSLFGLTRLEINGVPYESHRFATVALFASPLFALAWLPRLRSGSLAKVVLLSVVCLPAISTLVWFRLVAPNEMAKSWSNDIGSFNCRAQTNARVNERTEPRYVPISMWYLWGSCHPTYAPGAPSTFHWGFPINGALDGRPGLAVLAQYLRKDEPISAICSPDGKDRDDPVCGYAATHGLCRAEGSGALVCVLSSHDRLLIGAL